MNAKMCKKLRKHIKDMGFPVSTMKMSYVLDVKEGIDFPLTFIHEKGSARRIYQDIKHGRA